MHSLFQKCTEIYPRFPLPNLLKIISLLTSAVALSSSNVCWEGAGEDLVYLSPENRTIGDSKSSVKSYGVYIYGSGCSSCTVGEECSFLMAFESESYFDEKSTPFRDFMVTLIGPSLVHAYSIPYPNKSFKRGIGQYFLVSYQAWDPGNYSVQIAAECVPIPSKEAAHFPLIRIATFNLTILNRPVGDTPKKISPCELGKTGRWIFNPKGNRTRPPRNYPEALFAVDENRRMTKTAHSFRLSHYHQSRRQYSAIGVPPDEDDTYVFKEFECVSNSVDPNGFARAMLEKGVREISIVGDSHSRSIFRHMQVLVDGSFPSQEYHANVNWSISDKKGGHSLKINFYFIKGVFSKGEYGCSTEGGVDSWHPYSKNSDIVILSAASWSFLTCDDSAKAFATHVAQFLTHYTNLPHKNSTQFVWRPIPPYPKLSVFCKRIHKSVGNIAWANHLARTLLPTFGVNYFNFWDIEAPRYIDTCFLEPCPGHWVKDGHYSCFYRNKTRVYGVVGDAVARAMMYYLVNM